MIGSLLYLTASRPDIMFSTCLCARFQSDPRESHLIVVKHIFRYLKGTPTLGIWYPKDTGFDLVGYKDSDFAGCKIDRKSTSGSCQFLGRRLVFMVQQETTLMFLPRQPKQNTLLQVAVVLRSSGSEINSVTMGLC